MDMQTLLLETINREGSDLYITTNSPPMVRVEGINQPIGEDLFGPNETETLANSLMTDAEKATFATASEMNRQTFGCILQDVGRNMP